MNQRFRFDNDTRRYNYVQWGIVGGIDNYSRSLLYFDGDLVQQIVDGVTTSYMLDTAAPLTMVLAETTGTETIYYLHGLDLVVQNDGLSTEYFGSIAKW